MHLTNSIRLYLVCCLLSLVACQSEKKQDQAETAGTEVIKMAEPPQIGSMSGDTLNIGGRFVVFFGPEVTDGATPGVRDFKIVTEVLIDSLSSHTDIRAVYSTAAVFRIYSGQSGVMIFTKAALKEESGMLMTDESQAPLIKKGIHGYDTYWKMIKSYFFLE